MAAEKLKQNLIFCICYCHKRKYSYYHLMTPNPSTWIIGKCIHLIRNSKSCNFSNRKCEKETNWLSSSSQENVFLSYSFFVNAKLILILRYNNVEDNNVVLKVCVLNRTSTFSSSESTEYFDKWPYNKNYNYK